MLRLSNKSLLIECVVFIQCLLVIGSVQAQKIAPTNSISSGSSNKDSAFNRNFNLDSLVEVRDRLIVGSLFRKRDQVDMNTLRQQSYLSVQQMLKGNAAGVYVNENTGEPGSLQNMYIRGQAMPIIANRDAAMLQPVVYVNGIPSFQGYPLSYDIQSYDFSPLGTATNQLAVLDPNDIESIEVLKDAATLAKLGPNAANGVVWITTKKGYNGPRQISVNSYFGMAQKPSVTPTNSAYENQFRRPFYETYATDAEWAAYPTYLADSTDKNYYGAAKWADDYYKSKPFYANNASFASGTGRANFRFQINNMKSVGVEDATNIDRYGAGVFVNLLPVDWLQASTSVIATRLQRNRNRSFRDRFAETHYLPDFSNPLAPGGTVYADYLSELKSLAIDDNKNNSIIGTVQLGVTFKKFKLTNKTGIDYNEGLRDYFIPTTVLNDNNFLSTYFGVNQRFSSFTNATYEYALNDRHRFTFELGQSYQSDMSRYAYYFSYNTINDFVKVKSVSLDQNTGLGVVDINLKTWGLMDKIRIASVGFYGNIGYSFDDAFKATITARRDGSSALQPNKKWKSSVLGSVSYDFKKYLLNKNEAISNLIARVSIGQILRPFTDQRYSIGPQYVNDIGWGNDHIVGTYQNSPSASRPYRLGWVGYGIPWQYTVKRNIGFDFGLFSNVVFGSIDYYSNIDKNGVLPVPVNGESGFTQAFQSGTEVSNKGIDLSLNALIINNHSNPRKLNWLFNVNGGYNVNKLNALPGGLSSLVIGDRKFEVGKSIDQFWVFENNGIYNSEAEIPLSNGSKMTYNAIEFSKGDPIWKDVNGDGKISNEDRVLKGHYMPKLQGGVGSDITIMNFNLNFQFQYSLGGKLLDQQTQRHLDFANNEGSSDITSVKEITFWKKTFERSDYPLYNPWSDVVPYRLYQDLFLKDASFLKLRSVTIGYDFSKSVSYFSKIFNKAQLYFSANNVFTISKFKQNPELVGFSGIYSGFGMSIPRTFIGGIKLDF